MDIKKLKKLDEALTKFLYEEKLKPYKFTIDYDDGRPEGIIEYGKDEEDARTNLLKTHKYLQGKDQKITNVEEVQEDHEEVTEDFMMIHQSGDGPDASGKVKFFPTAFGYEYECTEKDFNGRGPQWSTIRTIEGIRNWFRNILFQFGAKDVYIGKYHWNINDFPKNESLNEDTEQEKIYNPTEFYIVQAFDTRDNRWFEYYRSYDNEDAYESYKDLKEMIKEGFMQGRFFKYPLLSAPGTMMYNTLDESLNEDVKNHVTGSNGKTVDYIDEECYDVAKKICDIIKKVIREFYNFNSDEEVNITLFDSNSMQGTHLQINFYTPTVIYNAGSIIIHKFFNTNHITDKDIDNKVHIFTGDLTSMTSPEAALSDVEYIVIDYLKKQEKNESLNEGNLGTTGITYPFRVVCRGVDGAPHNEIDILGCYKEKEAEEGFEATVEENINDEVAEIALEKFEDGKYIKLKTWHPEDDWTILESLNGDIITVVNIPLVTEKLYNRLVNVLYGNNRGKNRDYEQQQNVLNFLQEIEDRIPLESGVSIDLENYGFTADEINAIKKVVRDERVNESLNEKLINHKIKPQKKFMFDDMEDETGMNIIESTSDNDLELFEDAIDKLFNNEDSYKDQLWLIQSKGKIDDYKKYAVKEYGYTDKDLKLDLVQR